MDLYIFGVVIIFLKLADHMSNLLCLAKKEFYMRLKRKIKDLKSNKKSIFHVRNANRISS
jgi:hypothetical protein